MKWFCPTCNEYKKDRDVVKIDEEVEVLGFVSTFFGLMSSVFSGVGTGANCRECKSQCLVASRRQDDE